MNVVDELARLGIALNAEQAAAWKGITLPNKPVDDEGDKPARVPNFPRVDTGD